MADRLTGKNAALYLWDGSEWAIAGLLRQWTLDITAPLYEAAIKQDRWQRLHPSVLGTGTLTARHWYDVGFSLASLVLHNTGSDTFSRFEFILVVVDLGIGNFSSNPFSKVQGTGYYERSSLTAIHNEGYQDDFTLRLDTVPTIT